jgi:hypothetical protein
VWGSGGISPSFLTSVLDGGERSASRPDCFTPGETAPGTHDIGLWVGPEPVSSLCSTEIYIASAGDRTPASTPKPSAVPTELSPFHNYVLHDLKLYTSSERRSYKLISIRNIYDGFATSAARRWRCLGPNLSSQRL